MSDQRTFVMARRQIIGVFFILLGLALAVLVAPSLTSDTKAFNFETPPDPLSVSFNPPLMVTLAGIIFVVAGIASVAAGWVRAPAWLDRASAIAQGISALLMIPLVLVIALALSERNETNVANLFDQSLVLGTPFVLGAITGLWCERVGIINIGIEGMMLASAGVGFMAFAVLGESSSTPWLWFAILIAVLTGGLLAALHAWLSIALQINQIVSGVVINLFALGLTGFLRTEVIVPSGSSKGIATSDVGIPLLEKIPILGETLFTDKPLHLLMYLVVFFTWLVMYRTPWGLRVRACGENPEAAETLGIDVIRVRYQAVILGGFIAGIAGAWFSMEQQSGFEDNMTNAAGFIALAALIFGKWTPFGAFGAAIFFGFARALGSRLQLLKVSLGAEVTPRGNRVGGFEIPSEFFQSLPFFITIVVVAGALGRSIPPAAEGRPFNSSK